MIREQKQTDFIRNFLIPEFDKLDFFLGSGASLQAGIPTGNDLIWKFKKELYCSENDISPDLFKDIQSPFKRKILQDYFDTKNDYPILYADNEYSFYFKKCYSTLQARQTLISNYVNNVAPSLGHLCLGNFIITDKIPTVWTTNFDELIEAGVKKLNPAYSLNVISSANKDSLNSITNNNFHTLYKLHGDYRYDEIQNTDDELKSLETTISEKFSKSLFNRGLVIIGYAGKDNSIMQVLEQNIDNENFLSKGLYWLTPNKKILSERVKLLMERACNKNENSCVIEINDFDDFMYSMYRQYDKKNDIIDNEWKNYDTKKLPIEFSAKYIEPHFVKFNSFVAKNIPECRVFETDINSCEILNSITNNNNLIAGLYNGHIYVFENDEVIKSVFSTHILSEISGGSLPKKDLYKNYNSVFTGMLYKLIRQSLLDNGIKEFDRNKYYIAQSKQSYKNYIKYLGFKIDLSYINNSYFLHVRPTYYLTDVKGNDISDETNLIEINSLMSNLYNNKYNDEIRQIQRHLTKKDQNGNYSIPFKYKDFKFIFNYTPIHTKGSNETQMQNRFQTYIYPEPIMTFNAKQQDKIGINQIKGIAQHGPIDSSYFNNDFKRHSIKLAILSPNEYIKKLLVHLNMLNAKHTPANIKDGFLCNYEGFSSIFKRTLAIPTEQDNSNSLLYKLSEIENFTTEQFLNYIKSKIDFFSTKKGDFDVLIIFVPKEFKQYREDSAYDEDYNFHDAIKLYATDKDVRVQIIEEKSFNTTDTCKVMWALSTSLYAKSGGALWHPQILNNDTAFIGISYAQSKTSGTCIGCSQLFDSKGTGMRLILQKINDPLFFSKNNPYMKRDEARKTISKLREEYNRSALSSSLNRIIIHKTTPFTFEEKIGITQALEGINDIEMLQIQEITPWRALRMITKNGKLEAYGYAIKRGTVVKLSNDSFLLWTHGSVMHKELSGEKFNYYKNKRGIPKPLLIKRFYGKASGDTIIKEILMLTKMNWNSGDNLYKDLPVTLDFAKILSRMAKQKEALYDKPYDFRFFM